MLQGSKRPFLASTSGLPGLLPQLARGCDDLKQRGLDLGPAASLQAAIGIDPNLPIREPLAGGAQQLQHLLDIRNARAVIVPHARRDLPGSVAHPMLLGRTGQRLAADSCGAATDLPPDFLSSQGARRSLFTRSRGDRRRDTMSGASLDCLIAERSVTLKPFSVLGQVSCPRPARSPAPRCARPSCPPLPSRTPACRPGKRIVR
jgi:hypothetical protein